MLSQFITVTTADLSFSNRTLLPGLSLAVRHFDTVSPLRDSETFQSEKFASFGVLRLEFADFSEWPPVESASGEPVFTSVESNFIFFMRVRFAQSCKRVQRSPHFHAGSRFAKSDTSARITSVIAEHLFSMYFSVFFYSGMHKNGFVEQRPHFNKVT